MDIDITCLGVIVANLSLCFLHAKSYWGYMKTKKKVEKTYEEYIKQRGLVEKEQLKAMRGFKSEEAH